MLRVKKIGRSAAVVHNTLVKLLGSVWRSLLILSIMKSSQGSSMGKRADDKKGEKMERGSNEGSSDESVKSSMSVRSFSSVRSGGSARSGGSVPSYAQGTKSSSRRAQRRRINQEELNQSQRRKWDYGPVQGVALGEGVIVVIKKED